MGKFIRLDGVTADPTRYQVDMIDPILPDAGAMFLVDFTHPEEQWPAGVPTAVSPTSGIYYPNLAIDQLKSLTGLSQDADVKTRIATLGTGWTNPALGKLERTSKGGLHGIASQVTDPSGCTFGLGFSDPIKQFILDHSAVSGGATVGMHQFYVSVWGRTTRAALTGIANNTTNETEFTNTTTPASNILVKIGQGATTSTVSGGVAGTNMFTGSLNPWLASASSGFNWVGTKPTTPAGFAGRVMTLGANDMYASSADLRRAKAGRMVYRSYLEDLTVSGRTYAQVYALDLALYTKEVLTVGGRYYGDTFTDPATIP